MNRRLTLFFSVFALVLAAEHILAFFTGATDELGMLAGSFIVTIILYLMTTRPHTSPPKAIKPPHQHHWRHWYDTDGYYADRPHVNVPSRVYYCVTCREVRRSTDPIPHYQGRTS